MKKEKIVWIHSHTLLSTGGTRFIYEVTSLLSKKYEVELIVEKSSKEWKENLEKNHIKITEIGFLTSTSIFYWLFFPFFLIASFFRLKRYVKNNDIVISSMFPFNFLGSLLTKKHIYYCFEPFAFFYDKPLMQQEGNIKYALLLLLKICYSWIDITGVNKANLLLAINPSVGKYIKNIYNRKPDFYTYLGVDFDHFKYKNVRKNTLVTFFHSTDFTILKGTQFLLQALKYLKKYKNKFKIIISESVLNAKLKTDLQKEIDLLGFSDEVVFKGHIPYKQLPTYYSSSDSYLFLGDPSSQGATAASLSVLEAQACKLPVIRSIGNKDEIINGKTGFYANPRNSKDLATKMIYVIKNREKILKMAPNCLEHVKTVYTWRNVNKVFVQSIESIR